MAVVPGDPPPQECSMMVVPRPQWFPKLMDLSHITIDIPDSALGDLRQDPQAAAHEVRVATAIGLCAAGRLSHREAAHLAEMGRIEFSERLHAAHIPVHHLTAEDFALEFPDG